MSPAVLLHTKTCTIRCVCTDHMYIAGVSAPTATKKKVHNYGFLPLLYVHKSRDNYCPFRVGMVVRFRSSHTHTSKWPKGHLIDNVHICAHTWRVSCTIWVFLLYTCSRLGLHTHTQSGLWCVRCCYTRVVGSWIYLSNRFVFTSVTSLSRKNISHARSTTPVYIFGNVVSCISNMNSDNPNGTASAVSPIRP